MFWLCIDCAQNEMHDDEWTAVSSTQTIDHPGHLGFCRIPDGFDELNPSCLLLLQYLM